MSGDSSKRKSCSANTSEEEEKEEEESKLECVKRMFDLGGSAASVNAHLFDRGRFIARTRWHHQSATRIQRRRRIVFVFKPLRNCSDLKSYDTDTRNEITAEEQLNQSTRKRRRLSG